MYSYTVTLLRDVVYHIRRFGGRSPLWKCVRHCVHGHKHIIRLLVQLGQISSCNKILSLRETVAVCADQRSETSERTIFKHSSRKYNNNGVFYMPVQPFFICNWSTPVAIKTPFQRDMVDHIYGDLGAFSFM